MFDFGLSFWHILVIVVLAVIAVGPKDLPIVLRRFGQFMNKMRGMAREFQGQVDAAMKDAGMDGIRQDLQSLKTGVGAAMAPMQTVMTNVASSAMATPGSAPAAASASSPLPTLGEAGGDFARMFATGSAGETRVQGRALDGETP
ncbi:MAG: twin-arginine translocase TatA/TatE family subunit [Alphaproteobacteria bacterium]|nr:twin-arginine translocase TatA/TatE family subunit [Alphaproteobacteria bacterium]